MDTTTNNGDVSEPQTPGGLSDTDFDDNLGVPDSLTVLDIQGSQIVLNTEEDDGPTPRRIPFNALYQKPVKFKSFHRDIFISGVPIEVTIVDYETSHATHLINPNLYTISLRHGDFTWEIKKRYKHIQDLHHQLVMFRTSLNIPFPTKEHKRKRESFRNNAPISGKKKGLLPRFPKKPEMLVSYEQMGSRIKQLQEYLENLLAINIYRYHSATVHFLEVSHLSFIYELGIKGKEGMISKRSGSTQPGQSGCNCFGLCQNTCCIRWRHVCREVFCSSWRERWFFLKDTCFGYIDPSNGLTKCVVLYDQGFEVSSGIYSTGLQKAFQVVTFSRQLVIKCSTRSHRNEFLQCLKLHAAELARDFTQPNRYRSFAPIRSNITGTWFVDGGSYMSSVADAINAAKEEIFIADWWLSPEIYLKRPALDGDYWRLDKLLRRKAEEGVRIFILLYKEFEMALGLNSFYSKQALSTAHENIKVLRHPDHAKVGVFLWAHHEKIVCVDQTYAFVGGVDLCYGRWDDFEHRLTDLGSATPTLDVSTLKKKTSTAPAGDNFYPIPTPYYQKCGIQITEPEPEPEESDDDSEPELPQLQPGDQLLMPNFSQHLQPNTPAAERKYGISSITTKVKLKGKEILNLMYSQNEDSLDEPDHSAVNLAANNEDEDTTQDLCGSAKYWVGKDYVNFIVKDFTELESPLVDFIDRNTTPRMPWHDIAVCVQGNSARDIARHFIQRWNATKLEKARLNNSYPYLLPKSYNMDPVPDILQLEQYKVTCQVLRSVSTWSCGFLEPNMAEQSIHEAYVDAINRSQHYIYIENQFFITLPNKNSSIRNQIQETLYKRILRAHKEGATFRVFIILPLLPGFEGEVGGPTGKSALLNRLKDAGIEDPTKYISFYGLRNHSKLNGEPITELVYVHSKLMIIDDKTVICGSANINDRSLIGKRDSEIAVLIEDEEFEDGVMNGNAFPCGRLAGSLRKFLFKEHIGLIGKEHEKINIDITDPVSDHFYNDIWYSTASLNTEFYDKVFHCIPCDQVETFDQLKEYIAQKPLYLTEISRSEKMLESIEGHLVLFPLKFLCQENLTPAASSVEGIMPTSLWT
ncbi:phospholipase d [Holotrichia oblita]|uniref:Phospholipase d n=1 Tax=Holotrichia oblita TaxID=644536 RepID=A0ACB9T737_HOLOL|nr:phospholipase d [Holotrichia oblita]